MYDYVYIYMYIYIYTYTYIYIYIYMYIYIYILCMPMTPGVVFFFRPDGQGEEVPAVFSAGGDPRTAAVTFGAGDLHRS